MDAPRGPKRITKLPERALAPVALPKNDHLASICDRRRQSAASSREVRDYRFRRRSFLASPGGAFGLSSLLGCLLLLACGSTGRNQASGGASSGGSGNSAGSGIGGEGVPSSCLTPLEAAPAAVVRLTFGELSTSLAQLLGEEAAAAIDEELELNGENHAFPPQAAQSEGPVIDDRRLEVSDLLAQRGSSYVRKHFKAVTECEPTYECVTAFVGAFAQRAFRRALTDDELGALESVVAGAEALGAPPEQGAEYGVYAVLESPHFLYRSELGPRAAATQTGQVRLSDDELASAVSFFLTGAPPDDRLLEAATAHDLGSSDQLAPHVERLLATPQARRHLQRALGNYLGFPQLETLVVATDTYPEWNATLGHAMQRELDLLLEGTLWSGPLSRVLTSRTARIDPALASLYGVTFPAAGALLDDFGFADVELPEERAGLLTRAGMLTAQTRLESAAVIERGLWVAANIACEAPALLVAPDPHAPQAPTTANATEREKAEYRMAGSPCRDCHGAFEPYGMALDEFDAIGRFRASDAQGRPIDASVMLPPAPQGPGTQVSGGAGLSAALADDLFAGCLAQRFLEYARLYAIKDAQAKRCENQQLMAAGKPSVDVSFSEVLTSVVLSPSFATRVR